FELGVAHTVLAVPIHQQRATMHLDTVCTMVDVDAVVSGARYLAEQGLVDPSRMAVRGSSAGGFTVLSSLIRSDV
ncbi:Peptidase S9, prolyl oligopeptidase active site region protein, partial [human gut metagenome]